MTVSQVLAQLLGPGRLGRGQFGQELAIDAIRDVERERLDDPPADRLPLQPREIPKRKAAA